MQYMMLIYLDENSLTEAQRVKCYGESAAYARELQAAGKYIATSPLQPTFTATSIRHEQGKRVITDGPFAETREQLGGFFMVNAENLDEAIDIAAKIPAGQFGTVEIRPLLPVSGVPIFQTS
ncbi:MAG TPA: YciI family protein [Terriglobales bacterium]|nr:YciI family protein [Terriglobales bacterium]